MDKHTHIYMKTVQKAHMFNMLNYVFLFHECTFFSFCHTPTKTFFNDST
uniref:Uncharacterized protein n=1 Tax=Rhizophora mucronata TaxID=61149 RepID=A0A2P2P659_RHIMU